MADAYVTSATGSLGATGLKSLLTYFSDKFVAVKRNMGGPINYVKQDIGSELLVKGQSVQVPIYSVVSSSTLTDGSSVAKDDSTGTSKTVTLDTHRYQSLGTTMLGTALSGNTHSAGMIEQRLATMLDDIESDITALATSGFTTNVVGTYGSALTEANLVSGLSKLDIAKTPRPRYGFISPNALGFSSLIKISNFVNAQYIGSGNPLSGNPDAHHWNGVDWLKSNAVKTTGGTDTDNFVIYKDALIMASRPFQAPSAGLGVVSQNFSKDGMEFQIVTTFDGSKLAEQTTIHCLYGVAVGAESYGLLIKG